MKGALVVGGSEGADAQNPGVGDLLAIGGGLGLASALFAMFVQGSRETGPRRSEREV